MSAWPWRHGIDGDAGGDAEPASATVEAFVMWSIMMVAMMLPTALPAIAVFDNLSRRRALQVQATTPTVAVCRWLCRCLDRIFDRGGRRTDRAVARAALLTPMLQSASVALSAVILLTAGAFQFTAFKDACLSKCRTPLAFFLAEWRDGKPGALRLGFKHGSYCVGCCWAVMAVMFVVGAMNLVWMGALTLFMLGEKPARRIGGCAKYRASCWNVWGLCGLRGPPLSCKLWRRQLPSPRPVLRRAVAELAGLAEAPEIGRHHHLDGGRLDAEAFEGAAVAHARRRRRHCRMRNSST